MSVLYTIMPFQEMKHHQVNVYSWDVPANGIQFLRQKGYVHRDIKPGNIMRYIADDGR